MTVDAAPKLLEGLEDKSQLQKEPGPERQGETAKTYSQYQTTAGQLVTYIVWKCGSEVGFPISLPCQSLCVLASEVLKSRRWMLLRIHI